MTRKETTLGTARVRRGAVLAHIGGLFNARLARGFIAFAARLDLAASLVASDDIDMGDRSAITASVLLVFVAFGTNAATARFEVPHDINTLFTTHSRKDGAALLTRLAAETGGKNGLSAPRGLRTARARTRVGSRTSWARRAAAAVGEGVARAGTTSLAVAGRNGATGASIARVGTRVGDVAGRASRAHVVVRVGTGGAILATAV